MKYVLLLLGATVVYYFLARSAPVAPVVQTVAAQEIAPLTGGPRESAPSGRTAWKRPFDRTHAALDQVKARNGSGEF